MIKRLVFFFIPALFVFGAEHAAAYDFKVCLADPVGRISSFHVTTSLAACRDQDFGMVGAGLCVSGSTGDGCLISRITVVTSGGAPPTVWHAKEGAVDGGNWRFSKRELCHATSDGGWDCR